MRVIAVLVASLLLLVAMVGGAAGTPAAPAPDLPVVRAGAGSDAETGERAGTAAERAGTAADAEPDASRFADVPPGFTHAAAIEWLVAADISSGCAPGKFCPGQAVTRAQVASLLKVGLPHNTPTLVDDLCDLEVEGDPFATAAAESQDEADWGPVDGVGDAAGWVEPLAAPFVVGEPMLLVQVGTSTLAVQLTGDDGAEMGRHDHVQLAKKLVVAALGHGSTLPPPSDDADPDKPDHEADHDPDKPDHEADHDPDKPDAPDATRPCLPSDGSIVTYVKENGREVRYCATDLMHLDLACQPEPPGDLLPDGTYTTEPCEYLEEVIDGEERCETIVSTQEAWERIILGPGWIMAD